MSIVTVSPQGNRMKVLLMFLGVALASVSSQIYTFDSDLEGWIPRDVYWRWGDKASEPTNFPGTNDGFALMDTHEVPDQLYHGGFNYTEGGFFTVTFLGLANSKSSVTFELQKSYDSFDTVEVIFEYTGYINTTQDKFERITSYLQPDPEEFYLGFYCYIAHHDSSGANFHGCCVDEINVSLEDPRLSTLTPSETTVSSGGQTTAAGGGETTTAAGGGETTTAAGGGETTTAGGGETTTVRPETTAEVTTTEPTTTTEDPDHNYNFQLGVQGWTLGHMNGASWHRAKYDDVIVEGPGSPPAGPWMLYVRPEELYTATVLAQSPLYRALDTEVRVDLTFWLNGTVEFPSRLKVRRRLSLDVWDQFPVIDVDAFGDQINPEWITRSGVINNVAIGDVFTLNLDTSNDQKDLKIGWITLTGTMDGISVGEMFTLSLEGSLGEARTNQILVSEIFVSGVAETPVVDLNFYDFESGLAGWSQGNMDGGVWDLVSWSDVSSLGIPVPSSGSQFIMVNRFDLHSGVAAIETPHFALVPGTTKEINFKFWAKGNVIYPAALRMRLKTVDGDYEELPFLNLEHYGDTTEPTWVTLTESYLLSRPISVTTFYQLVIEADVGASLANVVAFDELIIRTIVV